MRSRAAILTSYSEPFSLRPIEVPPPGPHDVRVHLRAVGICHTDVAVARGHRDAPTPVVLGHEGAGIIESIGSGVSGIAPGDRVLLSYASCGRCRSCVGGMPSHCVASLAQNFGCTRDEGSPSIRLASGEPLHGGFFGQSSFATHALVRAREMVPLPPDIPFAVAAPVACGIQTGAGAIWRDASVRRGDSVLVVGCGAVGLSAVMAAAYAGATTIIATDVHESRLALATASGATGVFRAGETDISSAGARWAPEGFDAVVDTTGVGSVIEAAVGVLRPGGTAALIATGNGTQSIPLRAFSGRRVVGVLQGSSEPRSASAEIFAAYRAGRFGLDDLITTYDFDQINTAVEDMRAGRVAKPVLLFPGGDDDRS